MKPIDRIQAKADALALLGADPGASSEDIRSAWKRAAFASHPDRSDGDMREFLKAKKAYEFLTRGGDFDCEFDDESQEPEETVEQFRRPKAKTRVMNFSTELLEQSEELLNGTRYAEAYSDDVIFLDGKDVLQSGDPIVDHIADAVSFKGRSVTYLVASDVANGVNRVAVPSAVLENPRRQKPKIVVFSFAEEGPFEIDIPAELRDEISSGARRMSVRFERNQSNQ